MAKRLRHIVCGMSGGVDSSVAAFLLKRQGHRVTGLFMKNWDSLDETGVCQSDVDFEDAKYVCDKLHIPLYHVNFVQDYWHDVFANFLREYQTGTTPNPDILCNKHIKFDKFLNYAVEEFQADALATGHYARTDVGDDILYQRDAVANNGVKLLKGKDPLKDQTFFLSQISQKALQKTLFPLGDLTKAEVRDIAMSAGLEKIVKRKESMGICFIGNRKFQRFIQEYVEPNPGYFISVEDGKVVGQHNGCHLFTIGQRANISGQKHAWFVAGKDADAQTVCVAPNTYHPSLFCLTMVTGPLHWIHRVPEKLIYENKMQCMFRFQHIHVHPLVKCTVTLNEKKQGIISLAEPLRAVTPGQFAVLYQGEECLGGARITSLGPSLYELDKLVPESCTEDYSINVTK
ncbi:mitochondrial tRNA-specific 2-thiouridylase 1-like [Ptychodera flava]|uniref:mitochondrial tRNA-specific 2-thiouridylase 1-like n=1 Tax=Ptychodera flava TaxID=63121 RepID=UPI00396A6FA3